MSSFNDKYANKSVYDLLDKLQDSRIYHNADKEGINALIMELSNRKLNEKEKRIMASILSSDADALKSDVRLQTWLEEIRQTENQILKKNKTKVSQEEDEDEEEDVDPDDDEEEDQEDEADSVDLKKKRWFHDWATFMIVVAFAVAMGTLIASYLIYFFVKSEFLGD